MKKILVFFIIVLCLSSCSFNRTDDGAITTTKPAVGPVHLELIDVEFRGERHEYVRYHSGHGRSLSHWEGCKYCKERKNLQSD